VDPWLEHRQHLLSRRRCPHCAEAVAARHILAGAACPSCQAPLQLPGTADRAAAVLDAIRAGWRSSRHGVYLAVLLATFLAGWFPLLASFVTACAMLTANMMLLRRPLRWLPPVQRAVTRLASRVWFVLLLFASVAVHTMAAALIPAFGAGAIASAITGAVTTWLYVEGSLLLVTGAVERAASPEAA